MSQSVPDRGILSGSR